MLMGTASASESVLTRATVQNMIGMLCRRLAILQRNWCRFAAWPAVSVVARFRLTWTGCWEVMNSNNVVADDFLGHTVTDLRIWKDAQIQSGRGNIQFQQCCRRRFFFET